MRKFWKLWCESLGEKASDNSTEADIVALFRTTMVLLQALKCLLGNSDMIRQ